MTNDHTNFLPKEELISKKPFSIGILFDLTISFIFILGLIIFTLLVLAYNFLKLLYPILILMVLSIIFYKLINS
jgi:hypothetical protein